MPMLDYLRVLTAYLSARMGGVIERDERGSTTLEQVILAAILSAAALAAGAAIVAAIVKHQGAIK
jgi:hypothetical protein